MSQSVARTGSPIRSLRLVPFPSESGSGAPAPPEAARRSRAALPPPNPAKPRLLDQVRQAIRTRHYSFRTEEAYVGWIKRSILFHGKRHPADMGKPTTSGPSRSSSDIGT